MKNRIVIADDHKLFIEGIAALLDSVGEFDIVGRAGNGVDALNILRHQKPDLAILDITMPEIGGIEVARKIKAEMPNIKILILSVHRDLSMIIEVIKAGSDGYALKEAEPEELLSAIKVVMSGDIYLNSKVTTLLIRDYIQKLTVPVIKENFEDLSHREREIISLISEGLDVREIATKLCISRSTVDSHRRNIMRKLNCKNSRELTRYALHAGLLNLDE